MADQRKCNRCGVIRDHGTCRCGCPEFTLVRDPQRYLWLLVLVLVAGCEPGKAPTSKRLPLEDRVGIGVAIAMAVVPEMAVPEPDPAPEPPRPPRPGDVCPECEGRGKVSRDGRVWSTCLPCRGTGRVQAGDAGAGEGKAKTRIVYRKECDPKTGVCRLIPETEPAP